jgi:transposase
VLEDLISPSNVAKKYKISPHTIRDWIKKTGQALPKKYKKPALADSQDKPTNFPR